MRRQEDFKRDPKLVVSHTEQACRWHISKDKRNDFLSDILLDLVFPFFRDRQEQKQRNFNQYYHKCQGSNFQMRKWKVNPAQYVKNNYASTVCVAAGKEQKLAEKNCKWVVVANLFQIRLSEKVLWLFGMYRLCLLKTVGGEPKGEGGREPVGE